MGIKASPRQTSTQDRRTVRAFHPTSARDQFPAEPLTAPPASIAGLCRGRRMRCPVPASLPPIPPSVSPDVRYSSRSDEIEAKMAQSRLWRDGPASPRGLPHCPRRTWLKGPFINAPRPCPVCARYHAALLAAIRASHPAKPWPGDTEARRRHYRQPRQRRARLQLPGGTALEQHLGVTLWPTTLVVRSQPCYRTRKSRSDEQEQASSRPVESHYCYRQQTSFCRPPLAEHSGIPCSARPARTNDAASLHNRRKARAADHTDQNRHP